MYYKVKMLLEDGVEVEADSEEAAIEVFIMKIATGSIDESDFTVTESVEEA